MEVYLDNSATTKPYDEVVDYMGRVALETYGNPSSLHRLGKNAEDLLETARHTVASFIDCKDNELYFTSGGTESDNIAILGYARANVRSGKRVITQLTEHAAVLEAFKQLEKEGFEVVYIDVDESGFPNLDEIRKSINDETILLSFMYVNNENGAIFPIDEISAMCDHKKCMLHVDAVQAFGKMKISASKSRIDMMSISSHKIHGPRGIGALYVSNGVKITPVDYGGNQESGLRSGTQNLPAVAGFAKACELKFASLEADSEAIAGLKQEFISLVRNKIDDVIVNSPSESVCSVVNISFPGVKSEVLLHVLESKGIYVSTGSACNSKKNKFSYVLKAMKLKNNVIDSAIRFSFSVFNTKEEIEYTAGVLEKEIPLLRKIMR